MDSGPRKRNVVSPDVSRAIESFFALREWKGLWLGGGTCLAEYYFGHRISVDIDLYTADENLYREARRVLSRTSGLGAVGSLEAVRTDLHLSQFLLKCPSGAVVKLDVILDVPIELHSKVRCGRVWLDSLLDLASNKMGCLVQRDEVKDYVDLYFLLPRLSLDTAGALHCGLRKDAGLDPLILSSRLDLMETQSRPDFLRTDVPWENIQHFFRGMRADLLRMVEPR